MASRLVASSSDAIIVADPQGQIIVWNQAAEAMFGYQADEALGHTLDLIIPERLRARHWDGYHNTMRTGATRYATDLLAVPGLRHDGTRISLEFRVTLLAGPDGQPEAIAAILRDVTSRWQADQELRRELAELRAGHQDHAHSGESP